MRQLYVDNYVMTKSIFEIIDFLKIKLTNGKLRDIRYSEGDDNIVVTCPVHSGGHEATPACSVYVGEDDKLPMGYFSCFVCGASGPFTKFVAECMDTSEQIAKNWLITNFGKEVPRRYQMLEPITRKVRIQANMYVDPHQLDNLQSWCPYLQKRKISKATCMKFNVKYDQFHRQVIFPCYDNSGNILMLAKRAIDTKTFYLDKDKDKPIYCLNYINNNNLDRAIITEGPFDCLTAYEYGFPAVATLGSPSLDQITQIDKSSLRIIYTMFDNDEAGQKFTEFFKRHVSKRILVLEVKIPNGKKDINDLTRDEFYNALKNAK